MPGLRHGARPSLREVWALWGLYLLFAAAVFATYARLPVRELYHVSGNGRLAGAGRAVVFLNFPTALAAIALVTVVAARARNRAVTRLAVVAAVLCAVVFWPGVVEQNDLDVKWVNAFAAMGVALALALAVFVAARTGLGPRTRVHGDRARIAAAVLLVLLSLPWIVADLGFVIGRWPLFGSIFYSDEWWARFGHARLHPAVHLGHHHGMDGTLLALTAIHLSRSLGDLAPRVRRALGAYLAILLVYGLANVANDFWLEQLVKRDIGVTWDVPSMLVPTFSWAWLVLLVLAASGYVLLFRPASSGETIGRRRLLWPAACQIAVAALLVVGLLHGAHRHATPLGSAEDIVLVYAPEGTSQLFVARDGELSRLLADEDDTELAPDWSVDGRLVFQSNRDGNWELYSTNRDGTVLQRLTDDEAADGEPHWSRDGTRIAFVRNGDFYVRRSDGAVRKIADGADWPSWSPDGTFVVYESRSGRKHGVIGSGKDRSLASPDNEDLRYPAWSPHAKLLAYECLEGRYWHLCTLDIASGSERVLTHEHANDFAPAWSPDGTRIAFISDRDGNDQLFVMRADGRGVVRITSGQADKDTPAWLP